MSTLRVVDETSSPTCDEEPTPTAGLDLAGKQELEAARETIAQLQEKLEERSRELEREKALRKLLHRQHEELAATMKEQTEKVENRPGSQAEIRMDSAPVEDRSKQSLQDLMDNLRSAKGPRKLHESGAALLAKVRSLQDDNERNVLDKIRMLTEERDAALSKKQGLEGEIMRLQRQLEITETEYKLVDKTRVKALQAQLQAAINEKDMWQQKAAKFEDTCETLRVLSSLQRSLSKEDDIKHKYEVELKKCRAEKVLLTDQLEHALQDRNHVVQERNQLILERNALALQAQQEFERAERFQRLVLVLRKKAMATGSSAVHVPASPSRDQTHEFVYTNPLQK